MKAKVFIHKIRFTLVELLIVLGIIIIISGIGIRGYKNISGTLALELAETQVRKVVNSTIIEAKRNRIPMQIQITVPNDVNTEPCTISGGSASLVGYWGFDETEPENGLRSVKFKDPIDLIGGYYGKGAYFDGMDIEGNSSERTSLFDFNNNFYIEVMVKPSVEKLISSGSICEILSGSDHRGNDQLKLVLNGDGRGLRVGVFSKGPGGDDSLLSYVPGYFPDDGLWHKIGFYKYKEGDIIECAIYIDDHYFGKLEAKTIDSDMNGKTLTIGKRYDGILDEIKIYNIGNRIQTNLDPKNVFLTGGSTTINISPYGTIESNKNIRIASRHLTGLLDRVDLTRVNVKPECKIRKINTSVPSSGLLWIENRRFVKYEWDGGGKLHIITNSPYRDGSSNHKKFNIVKTVAIKTDGGVQ